MQPLTSIKVSRSARESLDRVVEIRTAELGRKPTLSEAIEFLADYWENH